MANLRTFGRIICTTFAAIRPYNASPISLFLFADSLAVFKSTLDKHWNSQAVKYDYQAELTGIGNRSDYCN